MALEGWEGMTAKVNEENSKKEKREETVRATHLLHTLTLYHYCTNTHKQPCPHSPPKKNIKKNTTREVRLIK